MKMTRRGKRQPNSRPIMTFLKMLKPVTVSAVAVLVSGACVDLNVTNPNEPERTRALANASDVEALIRSQYRVYWGVAQGGVDDEGGPGPALDAAAEVETSNSANNGTWDMGLQPPAPTVNQVAYTWGVWSRAPWLEMNRSLAAIRSGLLSIEEQNLGPKLSDEQMVKAFAKFVQGLHHGYIALMYDQGFILDETVGDPSELDLQPYDAIMAAARGYLAEARDIATANDFTLPAGWIGPASISDDRLIRLTHSYEARFMTAVARDPAERAAVEWSEVLNHVSDGIAADFGIDLDGPGGIWQSPYKERSSITSSVFLTLLGPADQSGGYSAWESASPNDRTPFLVDTDDRRINDGTLTGVGKYVEYRDFFNNQPARGNWFLSNYSPLWWRDISDSNGLGFAVELSLEEMEFLEAEAHIQMGNPDLALPLINDERVAEGELPEASVDGVSGTRCVPRAIGPIAKASGLAEGSCGDLLTTLIYEKRLELYQMSAGLSFFDSRGWGVLRTGRPIHIAIPAEDLQVLGLDVYTFGGGGAGSAQ